MRKQFLFSWNRFCRGMKFDFKAFEQKQKFMEIMPKSIPVLQKKNNKLPSESKATSLLRGAQRPHLIGVGDMARWKGSLSYSLNKSSGDSGLLYSGGTEVARASRGETLYERGGILIAGGGTLRARNGLDRESTKINRIRNTKIIMHFTISKCGQKSNWAKRKQQSIANFLSVSTKMSNEIVRVTWWDVIRVYEITMNSMQDVQSAVTFLWIWLIVWIMCVCVCVCI